MVPTPMLHVGPGKASVLTEVLRPFGKKVLVITGARSFQATAAHVALLEQLGDTVPDYQHYTVGIEPSPAIVDDAVKRFAAYKAEAVVAIGGGSVLDAGKAISAMLKLEEPVKDYLEGVGSKPSHPGIKVPFIAIPTTSGTGSESTRNAVLSEVGEHGYKRSLRHVNFVSNVTILDPALMVSCPRTVTAYSGMDAFTQLLESYLSTAATELSDSMAMLGLKYISSSLQDAYLDGTNITARTGMALAAYLSGITLTNAGLGLVHGLAAVIGGHKEIPHGVICSAMMASANKVAVKRLRRNASAHPAIRKYGLAGKQFCKVEHRSDEYYTDFLLQLIEKWVADMQIPKLGHYGLTNDDIRKLAPMGENKNNPVALSKDEMIEVMELAL